MHTQTPLGTLVTFEQYTTRRLPVLLGTARAICADDALAEDLVQDVLIKVHAKWASISEMAERDAYVRRMVVNEYISWRRKWSRLIPFADMNRPLHARDRPLDFASVQADRSALLAGIRRLPPRQRAVIGLRYFADLSDEAIGEALGCAQSTVRVHAARALKALRSTQDELSPAITDGDVR
jgi:RNA polymerase sigma-70 factor (sigma-E family)